MDDKEKIIAYDGNEKAWKKLTNAIMLKPQKGDNKSYRFVKFNKNNKVFKYHLENVATFSYNLAQKYNLKNELIELPSGKFYKCELFNVYETVNKKIYEIDLGYERIYLERKKCDVEKIFINIKNNRDRLNKLYNYFYKLVSIKSNTGDDISENKESFLLSQYNNLKIEKESVLYDYFTASHKLKKSEEIAEFIFPFPFNLSQKEAVKNALNNKISVIEGPPGCGKTQTIINLIANLIIKGKSVAVVSNNNTAIKNIKEKLDEVNMGFICALLGKIENKQLFFSNEYQEKIKNEKEIFLKKYPKQSVSYDFKNELIRLTESFNKQNELQKNKLALISLKAEYGKYEEYLEDKKDIINNIKINPNLASTEYHKIKIYLENISKISFWKRHKFKRRLRVKRVKLKINKRNNLSLIYVLNKYFYIAKIKELNEIISDIEDYLKVNNFDKYKKVYEENSLKYFTNHITNLVNKPLDDINMKLENYKQTFDDFIKKFPVILSTTHAILASKDNETIFDYIIFDEASQSDLLSSILAFSAAKNLVVVGDIKQLPEIDEINLIKPSNDYVRENNIPEEYNYVNNSALASVKKVFKNISVTLLKEHYRCHPLIINFCNQRFYDDQLVIMTNLANYKENPFQIIFTKGDRNCHWLEGKGSFNNREIAEIKNKINQLKDESKEINVGIITPFSEQSNKINEELNLSDNDTQIKAATVHSFQGQEKKDIILSTVLDNIGNKEEIGYFDRRVDFINNSALMNVAVSRAKRSLVLVVSKGIYNSNNKSIIHDLIKYIKYYGFHYSDEEYAKEGKVVSIFDFLHSNDEEELNRIKKAIMKDKHIKKNTSPAEYKFYELLKATIRKSGFHFQMHVPLIEFSYKNDYDNLDSKSIKYLSHEWTHVDFLIYRNITKEPVLAIEINGFTFHEKSAKQSEHDQIKKDFIERKGIKFISFSTIGESEIEKINDVMENLKKSYGM